ncbi:hypothetical protein SIID45300_01657 [Candidatus Magnetaquicoccaceae bacterium FCR-1]|uniref:Cadherin domain-containing protein n=1 Tax=Candidatus Magnetaquiglobus chichijimensis TaxID=3141448 RepID=A0ABQ0C8X3_9PROT
MLKYLIKFCLILSLIYLGPIKTGNAATPTSFNIDDFIALNVGNKWTYNSYDSTTGNSTSTFTVTGTEYINGYKATVVKDDDNNKDYYYRSSSGLYLIKESYSGYSIIYSPPVKYATSNVTTGSTYSSSGTVSFTLTGYESFALNYSSSVYIAGFETVTVQAGTFQAAKVQLSTKLSGWVNGNYIDVTESGNTWFVGGLGEIRSIVDATLYLNNQLTANESVSSELTTSNLPLNNTMTVATTGNGSVSSVPAGITCQTDCTENYSAGTYVTLTAAPASDSVFNGWSGACTGSGTCSVFMTAAKSVTANFKLINSPPTATNGSISTNEDTVYNGTLLATDLDNNGLTYSIVSQPIKGVVLITNTTTGAFTYTPNLNANGSDSFSFKTSDGKLDSNTATIAITIKPVNDPPIVSGSPATTALHKLLYSFTPVASDVDVDTLTFSILNKPVWANFHTKTGSLSGIPKITDNGIYKNIIISVNDGSKTVSLQAFTLEVPSFNLDIDGNGRYDALTDGLLILRYLNGMRDEALIKGAVDFSGTRTTATAIQSYLTGGLALLDIDGSGGTPDYKTDGLLIIRYLFGFRGDAMINGAIGATATRTSSEQIVNYINALIDF